MSEIDIGSLLMPYKEEFEYQAEKIIYNRILIAAQEFETGSEDFEKIYQVADTVKTTVHFNGNSLSLSIDYDTSIAGSNAYLAIDEGYKMLDVFFPDWIKDHIDPDNPEFMQKVEEYVYQEIQSRLGGD